jgi:hypothetical protein
VPSRLQLRQASGVRGLQAGDDLIRPFDLFGVRVGCAAIARCANVLPSRSRDDRNERDRRSLAFRMEVFGGEDLDRRAVGFLRR